MTREDANLNYVNQCLERGVTDFVEIDRAFDAGYDEGYKYAIDKACEWLRNTIIVGDVDDDGDTQFYMWGYNNTEGIIDGLRKAMIIALIIS